MMKSILSFLLIGIVSLNLSAQDNKAKNILDKVSAKNKQYKSMMAEFSFELDNEEEDIHELSEGKITLKGNKYRLLLMGFDTYFDGTTQYQHNIDAEEVNIQTPDEDEDGALDPAKIFSIYEEGFTYKYISESTSDQGKFHIIELFPTNDDMSFSSIKLFIDSKENQIKKLKSIGVDGNNITIKVLKLTPDVEVSEKEFIFDTKAHPDVEINDLR